MLCVQCALISLRVGLLLVWSLKCTHSFIYLLPLSHAFTHSLTRSYLLTLSLSPTHYTRTHSCAGWTLMHAAPPLDPQAQFDMSPVDWNAGAIAGIVIQHCQHAHTTATAHSTPTSTPLTDNPGKCAIYTLDNGHSLTYTDLLTALNRMGADIKTCDTYKQWFDRLVQSLNDETKQTNANNNSNSKSNSISNSNNSRLYPNPLRSLRGALATKQPKFGSTHCTRHMDKLVRTMRYMFSRIYLVIMFHTVDSVMTYLLTDYN